MGHPPVVVDIVYLANHRSKNDCGLFGLHNQRDNQTIKSCWEKPRSSTLVAKFRNSNSTQCGYPTKPKKLLGVGRNDI
jgi:aerobic-type carbon monoxide dehydrogenase small subunit (CoxS/CutS family)